MAFQLDLVSWIPSVFKVLFIVSLVTLLLSAISGLIFLILKKRKYEYNIRVFQNINGVPMELKGDKGGIFLDKSTEYRLFLLSKYRVGLRSDNIPYTISSSGKKTVYVLRKGLKNFQYLDVTITDDAKLKFNVHDEDVAWAINAYHKYKLPQKNDFLKQVLPVIGIGIFALVVIVVLYMILKNFNVLADVASALRESAIAIRDAKVGTTIIK